MDNFIEFSSGFDVQNLAAIALLMWLFFRRFDSKMEKLEKKIDAQSQRTDRLYEMFIDLLKNKS